MGTVRRQSIISTIFISAGFALGAFNTLVLVPQFADLAYLGLWNLLIQLSLTLSLFFTLGVIPATLKFWPLYKRQLPSGGNDLPTLSLAVAVMGALLFAAVTPWLFPLLERKYSFRSPLLVEYQWLILPFTLTLLFFYFFESWAWNLKQTILPNFLREVGVRMIFTLALLGLGLGWLSKQQATIIYGFSYLLPVLILGTVVWKKGPEFLVAFPSRLTARLWKRMAMLGLFVFTGQVFNLLAKTADSIIISSQSAGGLSDNGLFTIATFVVTVVEAPQRGMAAIATTTLLEAWRNKDMGRIRRMYTQTATLMFIFGLGILGIILINLPVLLNFMGGKFQENASLMTSLVLVLGLAKLIDLGTGLNSIVLMSSKHWRADFVFNLLFVAAAIPLNYFLIRRFNVMGSAYANLLALLVFNTFRSTFLYKKFGFHPFTWGHAKVLFLAVALLTAILLIPIIHRPLTTAIIQTLLYGPLLMMAVWKWKISEEFNDAVRAGFNRIGVRL